MLPVSKFGKEIGAAILVVLAILAGGFLAMKVVTHKPPVNTQRTAPEASTKVEFESRCVNGKKALIVAAQNSLLRPALPQSETYMLWDIDMAGRPIQCGEVQEVGPR